MYYLVSFSVLIMEQVPIYKRIHNYLYVIVIYLYKPNVILMCNINLTKSTNTFNNNF